MLRSIVVKREDGKLYLAAHDVDTIKALVFVLDDLLYLARLVRKKAEHIRAEEKAKDEALRLDMLLVRQRKNDEIRARYHEHLNNGCNGNKKLALAKIKDEFKLLSVDAKYILRN